MVIKAPTIHCCFLSAGFCCHVRQSCVFLPQHWSWIVCLHHAERVQRGQIPVSASVWGEIYNYIVCEIDPKWHVCVNSWLTLICPCSSVRHIAIPLPVGDCVFSLSWLLPTYFLFAVTYDVLQTLAEVAHYLHFYHEEEAHYHNLTESLSAANLSTLLWSVSRDWPHRVQCAKNKSEC